MTRGLAVLLLVAAALAVAAPAAAAKGRPRWPVRRRLAQLGFPKPDSCDELSENDFASAFSTLDGSCPQAEPWSCEGACFDGMHTVSCMPLHCMRWLWVDCSVAARCTYEMHRSAKQNAGPCVEHLPPLPCSSTTSARMLRPLRLLRRQGWMRRQQQTGCEQCCPECGCTVGSACMWATA